MIPEQQYLLSCAGLSRHEATTVRIVTDWFADQLTAKWQLVDTSDVDVLIADPDTSEGRAAMERAASRTKAVALVHRDSPTRPPSPHYLVRPVLASSIIGVLNEPPDPGGGLAAQADTTSGSAGAAPCWRSTLAEAVRGAIRDAPSSTVDVVDGPGGEVAIAAQRDRLVGVVRQIDASALTDATLYRVHRLDAIEALGRLRNGKETPLTPTLWRLVNALDANQTLYGASDEARVQLVRWPRLLAQSVERRHMRALTLLRRQPWRVDDVAARTGNVVSEVVPLCNFAWLTGALEVVDQGPPAAAAPQSHGEGTGSLVSRIRERLGVG